MEAELREIEQQSEQLQVEGQAAIAEYKELRQQLADAERLMAAAIQQPDRALGFLRPGRLIRVKEGQVRLKGRCRDAGNKADLTSCSVLHV